MIRFYVEVGNARKYLDVDSMDAARKMVSDTMKGTGTRRVIEEYLEVVCSTPQLVDTDS